MKISGRVGLGTTFSVEIGKRTVEQIAQTSNRSPEGLSVEAEMEEYISIFLSLLELSFAAPEPVRRNFVSILRTNIGRAARELQAATAEVAEIVAQRRVRRN